MTIDEIIIRIKELTRRTGISRAGVYQKLDPRSKYHDPAFPRPLRLGANSVGWKLSEVLAYIDGRDRA